MANAKHKALRSRGGASNRKPFGYIPKSKKMKLPKDPIIPGRFNH